MVAGQVRRVPGGGPGAALNAGRRPSWTLRILSCVSEGNCNAMAQASRKFLDISVFDGQSETPPTPATSGGFPT